MPAGGRLQQQDMEEMETDEECAICKDTKTDTTSNPGCKHTFCYGCIKRWCRTSNAFCPLCREPITELHTESGNMETVEPQTVEQPTDAEQSSALERFRELENEELDQVVNEQEDGNVNGEVVKPTSNKSRTARLAERNERV